MNSAHLHLIATHLPVMGSAFGVLVLVQGFLAKNRNTMLAAFSIMIIAALGAIISFATGEPAEESVEHLPGIAESTIEAHEASATATLISCIILGIAALAGAFALIKNLSWSRTVSGLVLLISIVSFGLAARTGYLGGQIRHSEISGNAVGPKNTNAPEQNPMQQNEKDDD